MGFCYGSIGPGQSRVIAPIKATGSERLIDARMFFSMNL
jgi:hypothetical protein